jgi:serine/threonine-protein kinase
VSAAWPAAVDVEVDDLAHRVGAVFASILHHDSGCHSYGVTVGGRSWFLKGSVTASAAPLLRNAAAVHEHVTHPAIVPLHAVVETPTGLVLVYPWVDGEVLYSGHGRAARQDPTSAHARFRALPLDDVLLALDQVLDAHLAFTEAGFVAGDLYDGTFLYDFAARWMWLIDLDEYRPGPFTVAVDRLPGSDRYMAPEESERGATIDERTTVFNLGRAAMVLLDEREVGEAFRGTPAMAAVLDHATQVDPAQRIPTVRALTSRWRQAVATR